jgi:hypothetical protein
MIRRISTIINLAHAALCLPEPSSCQARPTKTNDLPDGKISQGNSNSTEIFLVRRVLAALAVALALSSCSTLGPSTLRAARPSYNEVVENTGRQQTLMNIVRVSKKENPLFVDITEIDDTSTLSATPSGSITGLSTKAGAAGAASAMLTYSQSPTLRLIPLQGQQLIDQISTPIPPDALASLFNSDWPIINVLEFAADRLTPGFSDQAAL